MADITITPAGLPFGGADTVTSTRLNEARNPTAALTAASIGTADIADDAITPALIADNAVTTPSILDANVTFAKLTDVIDDDTMSTATDTTLATSESIKAYVDTSVNDSGITQTTGTAPYYGCRAFASYNGSTQVLNNGANIASVTRNSTANYTFNFDVDMPDVDYSIVVGGTFTGVLNSAYIAAYQTFSKTTSSFTIKAVGSGPSGGDTDQTIVDVAVFR